MGAEEKIFREIKSEVQVILPDAKVFLFGSRVNSTANNESDWDVLILTCNNPDKQIKRIIHDKLFPLSIKVSAFINTIILSEEDWNYNPSYYALHQSVKSKKILA